MVVEYYCLLHAITLRPHRRAAAPTLPPRPPPPCFPCLAEMGMLLGYEENARQRRLPALLCRLFRSHDPWPGHSPETQGVSWKIRKGNQHQPKPRMSLKWESDPHLGTRSGAKNRGLFSGQRQRSLLHTKTTHGSVAVVRILHQSHIDATDKPRKYPQQLRNPWNPTDPSQSLSGQRPHSFQLLGENKVRRTRASGLLSPQDLRRSAKPCVEI